jgi:Fe-S cluster biogenesis protein NfuA
MEQLLLRERVEEALNTIRPYLETDGGNVKVVNITDELVVQLELLGNCGNCPMSTMTLKAGVADAIKRAVPEIRSVIAINA